MDFLGDDFLIGVVLACLAGYLLRVLYDWAINWADKQERQARRDKGFITPPEKKPEGPPGLYKRFDTWWHNNRKKAWGGAIFIWFLIIFFTW